MLLCENQVWEEGRGRARNLLRAFERIMLLASGTVSPAASY